MDAVAETVLAYVRKEYLQEGDDQEVNENSPLISSGIVDSFSMVSLKYFLEKKYGIRIPDAQATAEAFDTVVGIAEVVRRHLKG